VIEVAERFDVPSEPDVVWSILANPHVVVGCVPGAAILSQGDDGTLETAVTVKFGPLNVRFLARALLELDHGQMVGHVSGTGKDAQGGARFRGNATFRVAASGAGSLVTVDGEVDISGRLASLIESGAGVVVKRMAAEFAECLRTRATG